MAEPRKQNRSCNECTRRKTRCDGHQPCANCRHHHIQDQCVYRQRHRRTNPSWKAVSELENAVEAREKLLQELLRLVNVQEVPNQVRLEIDRLSSGLCHRTSTTPSAAVDPIQNLSSVQNILLNDETGEHEWSETRVAQGGTASISDDVNGLAPLRQPNSYTGIFSGGAMMRALLLVSPAAKKIFVRLEQAANDEPSKDMRSNSPDHATAPPSLEQQVAAIDGYFAKFHNAIPLVDETWFRRTFSQRSRSDPAWTALSNTILALGSIAAGSDTAHMYYHRCAKDAIGYDVFCSGNLETLQALILLGGIYLNYTNSPNAGYLIRGTAFRMAIAMGLHRDTVTPSYHGQPTTFRHTVAQQGGADPLLRLELRRRAWWSLVSSDVFAGVTWGRPVSCTWDPLSMDVKFPEPRLPSVISAVAADDDGGFESHAEAAGASKIIRGGFKLTCLLSRIEQRKAQLTTMTAREILAADAQIQEWYEAHLAHGKVGQIYSNGPVLRVYMLQDSALGARLVLTRQYLLYLAFNMLDPRTMTAEDWRVISTCQTTATSIIAVICARMPRDRLSVWISTFHLFQPCIVLLLSIALADRLQAVTDEQIDGWKKSLASARHAYREMFPYKRQSDKYGEILEQLHQVIVVEGAEPRQQSNDHPAASLEPQALDFDFPFQESAWDTLQYAFDFDMEFEYPGFQDMENRFGQYDVYD